jgi:hypothetical protein
MPFLTDATGRGVSTAPPRPVADKPAPRNDGFGDPRAKTLGAEPESRRFLGRHDGPLSALREATRLTVAHGRPRSSKAGPRRVRRPLQNCEERGAGPYQAEGRNPRKAKGPASES